jgi:hypothetical protein
MPTVYQSQLAYSDLLKNQYNKKTYSDITIKFQGKIKKLKKDKNQQLYLHKIVLCNSIYFENIFKKDKSIKELTINEDENQFPIYLKFLYTGAIDLRNDEMITIFKYSNHVKI